MTRELKLLLMLTIDVKLILETPLHIGNSSVHEPRHFMRDSRGRLYIRAGTVKGLHRAATRHIASGMGLPVCEAGCYPIDGQKPCIICQLFGASWVEGRLYYRDLSIAASGTDVTVETTTISRSTQNRQRRVRRSTSQQTFETLPSGTTLSGQINHLLYDKGHLGLALTALRGIQSIGAANAVGYGLCRVQAYALDKNKTRMDEHDLGSALMLLRPRTP